MNRFLTAFRIPHPLTVLLLPALWMAGCRAVQPATSRLSPEALRADAQVAWDTYAACHPSFTWYTPYDSLRAGFDRLQQSITDSLYPEQFRMRLAEWVAMIRCGHTSTRPARGARRGRSFPFPLQLKVLPGDSLVVLANGHRNDSLLTRGAIVHAINGRPAEKILDTLRRFISADGHHDSFRDQIISNNFPGVYTPVIGFSDYYLVDYSTIHGVRRTDTVRNLQPPSRDSLRPRPQPQPVRRADRMARYRQLRIDTAAGLALMDLHTFTDGRLRSFFRRSFRTLNRAGIRHLAIELRENGGGDVTKSALLTRYLANKPFRVADTVAALDCRFPHRNLVDFNHRFMYRLQRSLLSHRAADGRWHYGYFERKQYQPKRRGHFDGEVYILTGGVTFSAATMFINPLKGQPNIHVIGEETGGGAYGNSSIQIPYVRLPNSGVQIRLPLYRVVTDRRLPHDGRGILPDIPVPATSWHIANRLDPKMTKVYELVRSGRQPVSESKEDGRHR